MRKTVLVVLVLALSVAMEEVKADFTFGTPTNLGPTVNGSDADYDPTISADGLELYFNSYRPGGLGQADIWVTTRRTKAEPWGEPVNLGSTINSPAPERAPSISVDGLMLYFNSGRPGGQGGRDLWVTTRKSKSDPWGEPANLGPTVNSPGDEHAPSISTDDLELYFSVNAGESGRPGGSGKWDIWVTTRKTKAEPWGEPVNLGSKVNSPVSDGSPFISNDGLSLYFDSYRGDTGEESGIWVTKRKTIRDPWGTSVNVGPLNSEGWDANPDISRDGSTLYFASYRSGGSGSADLWMVSLRKPGAKSGSLLGTWELVSYKYGDRKEFSDSPKSRRRIKMIMDTHYLWFDIDTSTEEIRIGAGGPYSLIGDTYTESNDFSGEGMKAYAGTKHTFTVRVESDKFIQSGALSSGLKIEEVWRRIK